MLINGVGRRSGPETRVMFEPRRADRQQVTHTPTTSFAFEIAGPDPAGRESSRRYPSLTIREKKDNKRSQRVSDQVKVCVRKNRVADRSR